MLVYIPLFFRASNIPDADYEVKIKVDGKWLNDDKPGTFCYGRCMFYVCLKALLSFSSIVWDKYNIYLDIFAGEGTILRG